MVNIVPTKQSESVREHIPAFIILTKFLTTQLLAPIQPDHLRARVKWTFLSLLLIYIPLG